jgi:ribosomal protein S18 acetylase RimI-like enzyme
MSGAAIRPATGADDAALLAVDAATWSAFASPAPPPPPEVPFFDRGIAPGDVLVAVVDGAVVGYAAIGASIPVPSNAHVMMVRALAVDPAHQRRGLGRRLVQAAVTEARTRGARRLRLRVLGPNDGARRLYEGCGFVVEGVLREEFLLDGRYVDDVLMARDLTNPEGAR